jgi:hypothetical protein
MSGLLTTGVLSQRFQPTQLADLILWTDAKDTSTITKFSGTDAVSVWADKSSQGNDLEGNTSSDSPNSGTHTINGINALDFRGATIAYLTSKANIATISGNSARNSFFVMQFDSGDWGGTQNYALFHHGVIELATNMWGIFSNGLFFGDGPRWVLEIDPGDFSFNYSNSPVVKGEPIIFEIKHNGGSTTSGTKLYVNGTELSLTNANETINTSASPMTVGFYDTGFGSGPVLRGRIGEIIYYASEKTTAERREIYAYIKEKWGVS